MGRSVGLIKIGFMGVVLALVPIFWRYSDKEILACKSFTLPNPPALVGALAVNRELENVEYILHGAIKGPESLLVEDGIIYTGLHDGRIVRIENGKITKSVSLTKEKACGTYDAEPRCGRPLGIRRLNKDKLVVIDAYKGIYVVDVNHGTSEMIYSSAKPIGGRRPRFLNDLDVLSEDELIVSDSSVNWERRNFMYPILENSGDSRVFRYRMSSGEVDVLIDGLHFANGIQILPGQREFVFAELGKARIWRYNLETNKKKIFAENLPGLPDNIRLSQNGTLWVGLAVLRHEHAPSLIDRLAPLPQVRQFLLDIVPARWWLSLLPMFRSPHSLVVQLDFEGRIISSLHDPEGRRLGAVSQVTDDGNHLYFGSFDAEYIGRLKKF